LGLGSGPADQYRRCQPSLVRKPAVSFVPEVLLPLEPAVKKHRAASRLSSSR